MPSLSRCMCLKECQPFWKHDISRPEQWWSLLWKHALEKNSTSFFFVSWVSAVLKLKGSFRWHDQRRWTLASLLPARDKVSLQGVATFFLPETKEVLYNPVCLKNWSYALFWDNKGPILEHNMPRETTINCEACYDLPENHLKPAKSSESCSLLSSGVLFT